MERRLAAILATDVVGYSRLMAADEAGTLARLTHLRTEVIEPKISQFHGHIVGSAGDSLLIEFASAVHAVECAVQVQETLTEQNAQLPEDRHMAFRAGVNLGDVIVEHGTIHGDGVNVAARIEKLAEPGGVCIGRSVYDQVKGKLSYAYMDLGDQKVHNITEPVRVFKVRLEGGALRQQPVAVGLHSKALYVSTTDAFASKWLVPRLVEFQRAYDDIDVWLWTSDKLADFITDKIEIAIRYGRGQYAGLKSELLMEEDVSPVCNPILLEKPHSLKEPSDLKYHTLIHDYFHVDWGMWLKIAEAEGVNPRRGPHFYSSAQVIQAALLGEGVALGRSVLVSGDIAAGRLVRPFPMSLPAKLAYYLVYPPDALDQRNVHLFREWLRTEIFRPSP